MPKAAEIHIQTRAPGPPATIAVATPTMLPVPIVAASAVIRAENGEISPLPLFFLDSGLRSLLRDGNKFLQGRNLNLNVRKIPVPTRRTSIAGPQTKSSIEVRILDKLMINKKPFLILS
jgi:hypothetical protein